MYNLNKSNNNKNNILVAIVPKDGTKESAKKIKDLVGGLCITELNLDKNSKFTYSTVVPKDRIYCIYFNNEI